MQEFQLPGRAESLADKCGFTSLGLPSQLGRSKKGLVATSLSGLSSTEVDSALLNANMFAQPATSYDHGALAPEACTGVTHGELHLPGLEPIEMKIGYLWHGQNTDPNRKEPVFAVYLSDGAMLGTYFGRAFKSLAAQQ